VQTSPVIFWCVLVYVLADHFDPQLPDMLQLFSSWGYQKGSLIFLGIDGQHRLSLLPYINYERLIMIYLPVNLNDQNDTPNTSWEYYLAWGIGGGALEYITDTFVISILASYSWHFRSKFIIGLLIMFFDIISTWYYDWCHIFATLSIVLRLRSHLHVLMSWSYDAFLFLIWCIFVFIWPKLVCFIYCPVIILCNKESSLC